jgi:SAM-dependent methyltransferase
VSSSPLDGAAVQWLQPLPRGRPVARDAYLLEAAAGQRVIHVGFVDEHLLPGHLAAGNWLHARMAEVASSLVGLDIAEDSVAWAREEGSEVYCVDAQMPEQVEALGLEAADVVVAGEVIEHLDSPGPFLLAMHLLVRPGGRLVVTTPNAYRPLNSLVPVSGSELVHPDHTAWHSPHTLRNLLERSGWEVVESGYYQNAGERLPRGRGVRRYLEGAAANAVHGLSGRVARFIPSWSDGLIAVARRASPAGAV